MNRRLRPAELDFSRHSRRLCCFLCSKKGQPVGAHLQKSHQLLDGQYDATAAPMILLTGLQFQGVGAP
ncbi:hypothetical protein ACSS6W_005480 [Trichoderma asperelloides]